MSATNATAPAPMADNYAGNIVENLQASLNVLRDRWNSNAGYRRFATQAEARVALEHVAEVVASIGLALPFNKSGMVMPVCDALDAIVGPARC